MHKGFSQFQRELSVHDLRERLRSLSADVVFLQEVVGSHSRHARRYGNWPVTPQYEFLADQLWSAYAYGKNSVYDAGHHGNAILSKYPIVKWDNVDISMSRLERRGLLHCEIQVPGWSRPLHCINVHLGLFGHWRKRQLESSPCADTGTDRGVRECTRATRAHFSRDDAVVASGPYLHAWFSRETRAGPRGPTLGTHIRSSGTVRTTGTPGAVTVYCRTRRAVFFSTNC